MTIMMTAAPPTPTINSRLSVKKSPIPPPVPVSLVVVVSAASFTVTVTTSDALIPLAS